MVQRVPPQVSSQTSSSSPTSGAANNSQQADAAQNQHTAHVQQIIQQLIGNLGELGQNATFNTTNNVETNGMEVHIDLGNVSQFINENDIRSRVRNIRRFLNMTDARLNRLHVI